MDYKEYEEKISRCISEIEKMTKKEKASAEHIFDLENQINALTLRINELEKEKADCKEEECNLRLENITKASIIVNSEIREDIINILKENRVAQGRIDEMEDINKEIEKKSAKLSHYETFVELGNIIIQQTRKTNKKRFGKIFGEEFFGGKGDE